MNKPEEIISVNFFTKFREEVDLLVKMKMKEAIEGTKFLHVENDIRQQSKRVEFLIETLGILDHGSYPVPYLIGSVRAWILTNRRPDHTPSKMFYDGDNVGGIRACMGYEKLPSTTVLCFNKFWYNGFIKYCSVFSYMDMPSYNFWLLFEDKEDGTFSVVKAVDYDISPNGTLVRE
jgi:hypothetical protein